MLHQPAFLPGRSGRRVPFLRAVCLASLLSGIVLGRFSIATAQPNDADADQELVQLNFPNEMEISVLVDYVSNRLGIKILYDEQINGKQVAIRAPDKVPAESLLGVLQSALKMKGLILVDADAAGWKRIVPAAQLPRVATPGIASEVVKQFGRGTPVTQAFILEHADPQQTDQLIKSFLTEEGSNSVVMPEQGILIVSDYATNMLNIANWVELVDRPRREYVREFIQLEHVGAEELATQVTQFIAAENQARGQQAGTVQVTAVARTNQLVLIGRESDIVPIRKLVTKLDIPLQVTTRSYPFENVSAERIDELMASILEETTAARLYRATIDESENILIVTTTDAIHRQLENLKRTRDVAARPGQSPIRFYKIKNLPVSELMNTIRGIEQQTVTQPSPNPELPPLAQDGRIRPVLGVEDGVDVGVPAGANQPPPAPAPVQTLPAPPSYRGAESQRVPPETSEPVDAIGSAGSLLGRARITADVHTNTLIVVAEPAVQRIYADLIEKLDRRRPQVLIEAKVVILNTSDDFSLGVEFSTGDRDGSRRLLTFSSFGLSEVDPATGALSLIPGLGFNGTLVDPDVADVVLRALTNHSRSKVVSAPRILVNDNAEGQLSSVAEVPFTSVNASNTVATTSFAGFAEAGTTVTATPRISDEDHLQLDFVVTLNTFTGGGGDGVPPPRQTDEVRSQVTIPDGHTVIVGGLNRSGESWDFTSMPFIDQIPLLRYLGGNETRNQNAAAMFVFIKPIVLRDDKFRDLKYISERDLNCAKECTNYPKSEPIWLR